MGCSAWRKGRSAQNAPVTGHRHGDAGSDLVACRAIRTGVARNSGRSAEARHALTFQPDDLLRSWPEALSGIMICMTPNVCAERADSGLRDRPRHYKLG